MSPLSRRRSPGLSSVGTCWALALLAGLVGLGLRLAIPASPPDEATREVLRFFDPTGAGAERPRR